MAWEAVAAVGLKPPPRERLVAAGQCGESGRKRRVAAEQLASSAGRSANRVILAATRKCQVRVGPVAVTMAGLVSSRGLAMLGRSRVIEVVLVG